VVALHRLRHRSERADRVLERWLRGEEVGRLPARVRQDLQEIGASSRIGSGSGLNAAAIDTIKPASVANAIVRPPRLPSVMRSTNPKRNFKTTIAKPSAAVIACQRRNGPRNVASAAMTTATPKPMNTHVDCALR